MQSKFRDNNEMEMFPSFTSISGSGARQEELKKWMQRNSLIDKPDPRSAGTYLHKSLLEHHEMLPLF